MPEYIEREALMERLKASPLFGNIRDGGFFIQDGVLDLVKQQPAADVVERTNWIDAKTNPPKEQGKYLCAMGSFCIDICSYALNLEKVDEYDFYKQKRSGWYQYDSEYGHFERDDVTHYMPLPDPPKEGE